MDEPTTEPVSPAALPSLVEFVYLVLGLALVYQYRWIFDDSFVYYRYVDNALFTGAGLVANAGEYVEGFTSPFHVLVLLALRASGLGYETINVTLGLGGFALFWFLCVRANREFGSSDRGESGSAVNLPLALLAANYSVLSFFTAGNEGPWMHLAGVVLVLFILRPSSSVRAIAVCWIPLVRPELTLALALVFAFAWGRRNRFPWTLFVAALLVNGGWIAFRVLYYADLLPNTFYLKASTRPIEGTNLEAGLAYLVDATRPYAIPLVAGLIVATLAAARAGVRRVSERAVVWAAAVAVGGYVVISGGSAMHYYYLAFPFTLVVLSSGGIVERCGAQRVLAPAALILCALTASRFPASLSEHPITRNDRMSTLPSRTVFTDPSFFRHRELVPNQWPSIEEQRAFAPGLAESGYDSVTDIAWCNAVYAHYDVRSVHAFGLTDAILARVDTPEIKRGHKPALEALAHDLIAIQLAAGDAGLAVGPGTYTQAIEAGTAPGWMVANAEAIAVIERKIFNDHDLVENLRLAFTFPGPIGIGSHRGL